MNGNSRMGKISGASVSECLSGSDEPVIRSLLPPVSLNIILLFDVLTKKKGKRGHTSKILISIAGKPSTGS
jgi:hypothetical protein